jgi:hypothetical protein
MQKGTGTNFALTDVEHKTVYFGNGMNVFPLEDATAAVAHELAHIYLGHLGKVTKTEEDAADIQVVKWGYGEQSIRLFTILEESEKLGLSRGPAKSKTHRDIPDRMALVRKFVDGKTK